MLARIVRRDEEIQNGDDDGRQRRREGVMKEVAYNNC